MAIPRTVFGEEHEMFRATVKDFITREIAPHHDKWEKDGIVPRALWHKAGEAGLLLTGIPVRVGNFSVIPAAQLRRLVVVSELWNHYAAAVFKARTPKATVPTARAPRLAGRSRMNFVDLVTHGLSALSVHSELIGVRLLVVAAVLISVRSLA